MGRLQKAVGSGDTQSVKREALRSITLIESLIEMRSQRQTSRVERMASHLDRLNVELVDVKEKLATDPLTEIPNRAAFDEHLHRLVDVQPVVSVRATLFMIDVDHFKWVNDHYGHPVGDTVLKEVAKQFDKSLRRRGDFVARFGGDEFAGIVQGVESDGVRQICEQLLFSIRDMDTLHEGETIRVSVSIGAVSFAQGDDTRSWLERADRALYLAKEAGRDRFVFLDDEVDETPEPA
jgi:diguanylate cyclase